MDSLIWIGATLSLVGLVGIVYCIVAMARAKRASLDDETLRARIQKLIPVNLGSLFLSVIGLMTVVVGVLLG